MCLKWLSSQATSSVPHFVVFIGTNGLFSRARLLLISCHNNKLFLFTELANIVVVIVTNPMFILPWVHEKFTVKFTMSNVDGYAIYMHIGCLNCPERARHVVSGSWRAQDVVSGLCSAQQVVNGSWRAQQVVSGLWRAQQVVSGSWRAQQVVSWSWRAHQVVSGSWRAHQVVTESA